MPHEIQEAHSVEEVSVHIRCPDAMPCCGDQPYLDTWDKNESRSIHCLHCGRHTESHFTRSLAYADWTEMMIERALAPKSRPKKIMCISNPC
jgi:hypothetical protein